MSFVLKYSVVSYGTECAFSSVIYNIPYFFVWISIIWKLNQMFLATKNCYWTLFQGTNFYLFSTLLVKFPRSFLQQYRVRVNNKINKLSLGSSPSSVAKCVTLGKLSSLWDSMLHQLYKMVTLSGFLKLFMVLKCTVFIPTKQFLHLEDLILSDIIWNSALFFCVNYERIELLTSNNYLL